MRKTARDRVIQLSSFPQMLQGILLELGVTLTPNSTLLDFGCGDGRNVYMLRQMGFNAFGADVESFGADVELVTPCQDLRRRFEEEQGITLDPHVIRSIAMTPYKIPFADNTFDVVYSGQVFEHVQNYAESLAEIERALKPGGCSFHLFPRDSDQSKPMSSCPWPVPSSNILIWPFGP